MVETVVILTPKIVCDYREVKNLCRVRNLHTRFENKIVCQFSLCALPCLEEKEKEREKRLSSKERRQHKDQRSEHVYRLSSPHMKRKEGVRECKLFAFTKRIF
jgi:hypothetical protein